MRNSLDRHDPITYEQPLPLVLRIAQNRRLAQRKMTLRQRVAHELRYRLAMLDTTLGWAVFVLLLMAAIVASYLSRGA